MKEFEYLAVGVSIILGLNVTTLLNSLLSLFLPAIGSEWNGSGFGLWKSYSMLYSDVRPEIWKHAGYIS